MMVMTRWMVTIGVTLALLSTLLGGALALGSDASATNGSFSPAESLGQARSGHTATTLPDGRVLIVGGKGDGNDFLPSAELWDPASGSFRPAGSLGQARSSHTANVLLDGRVLVIGGRGDDGRLATAELWDPASGTFSAAGALEKARSGHTANVLLDGRVLVVGGSSGDEFLATAELWDPASGTFSAAGALEKARSGHTANVLLDGRVLVVGGASDAFLNSVPTAAEVWDAASGNFAPAGSLLEARSAGHTTTVLLDGRVLVVGGEDAAQDTLGSAEVWHPAIDTFAPAGSLAEKRWNHTATPLRDGRVLVVGGYDYYGRGFLDSVEVWDPDSSSFAPAGTLVEARSRHTASRLPDGRVLIVGGDDGDSPLASAELWQPRQDEPMGTPRPTSPPEPRVTLSPTPEPSKQTIERELADSMGWAAWKPYRKSPAGAAFDSFEAGARTGVIFDDLETELHSSVDYIVLFRFPDAERLDRYWQGRATAAASRAPISSAPCKDGRPGRGDWEHGEYLCYESDAGTALLRWTDARTDTYGVVNAVAGSGNLKSLFRHWESVLRGPAAGEAPPTGETPSATTFTVAEKVLLKGIRHGSRGPACPGVTRTPPAPWPRSGASRTAR